MNKHYPNRVRAQFSTSSTAWNIIGTDGTGYASYAALVAAGATPFPGAPRDFPTGLPKMLARSVATGGVANGSPFSIRTQGIATPGLEDDLIDGSGQTYIYEDDDVKLVWLKKSVGTDVVELSGFY